MNDADREQVDRVVALLRDVLGADLLGAYLFGSAVLGGLRPRSDVDVLAVSSRPTTPHEQRRLVERLLAVSGRLGRSVELTIVVQRDVRPWRYPPSFDFQYGDWLRDDFERGDHAPWPSRTSPDLAVLIAMALRADVPLHGPPPAQVLDDVPSDDVRRASVDGLDGLLGELEPDTRNVVLTLARIWRTLATHELVAKDQAADWALERLPEEHRAVLERARAIYAGEADERWDDLRARLRPHVGHVVAQIEGLAVVVPRG